MLHRFVVRCGFSLALLVASAVPAVAQPAVRPDAEREIGPRFNRAALDSLLTYPEEARREKLSGTVVVVMDVDARGVGWRSEVEEGVHPLLDKAAVDALRSYRYTPARRRGTNVPGRIVIPVAYKADSLSGRIVVRPDDFIPTFDQSVNADEDATYDAHRLYAAIRYPEAARRNGIEGDVMVRVLIDRNGSAIASQIDACDHPSLCDAAQAAVIATQYQPAMYDGKPVASWMQIPIGFRLN